MEKVLGYVIDQPEDKYKYKFYFENDEDKIFTFLMQFQEYERIITDSLDKFICSALPGEVISESFNEKFLDEMNEKVIELYFFGIKPLNFVEIEPGVMKEVKSNE